MSLYYLSHCFSSFFPSTFVPSSLCLFPFCLVKLFMRDFFQTKTVFPCRKMHIIFTYILQKKCIFTDHELGQYCLSLILLFFHTLYVTLPLKIPVFFTEKQPDVSVGENGEERDLQRGRKMWVVVREVKISKPSKTLLTECLVYTI